MGVHVCVYMCVCVYSCIYEVLSVFSSLHFQNRRMVIRDIAASLILLFFIVYAIRMNVKGDETQLRCSL